MPPDEDPGRLREQLLAAHEELVRRDEAFRAWDHEVAQLRGERDALERQVHELESTVAAMRDTRAWRLAERWWSIRGRLRGEARP